MKGNLMKALYDIVLFDLDGTLTKSDPGIINSVKATLKQMDCPVPSNLRRFIGPPLYTSFVDFCGMTEEQSQRSIMLYRDYYNAKGIFDNSVYPGILDLLKDLKEAGAKVCVATSKPQSAAEIVLNYFEITPLLDFISGASEDDRSSEKVTLIENGLKKCGIPADRAVMIGDTRFDAEGAKGANVDFIGALYGYGTREEMINAGASRFAKDAQELRSLLIKTED